MALSVFAFKRAWTGSYNILQPESVIKVLLCDVWAKVLFLSPRDRYAFIAG